MVLCIEIICSFVKNLIERLLFIYIALSYGRERNHPKLKFKSNRNKERGERIRYCNLLNLKGNKRL